MVPIFPKATIRRDVAEGEGYFNVNPVSSIGSDRSRELTAGMRRDAIGKPRAFLRRALFPRCHLVNGAAQFASPSRVTPARASQAGGLLVAVPGGGGKKR